LPNPSSVIANSTGMTTAARIARRTAAALAHSRQLPGVLVSLHRRLSVATESTPTPLDTARSLLRT